MQSIYRLMPAELFHRCDPGQFKFTTTAELAGITGIIGQQRAVEAIDFGIKIKQEGYNLFALGSSAIAIHSVVKKRLCGKVCQQPTPDDWCYYNDFSESHKPRVLRLPPGRGRQLQTDIDRLVEELCAAIPAAFESEDYHARKQEIVDEFKKRREAAYDELYQYAREQDITIMRTPNGVVFAPMAKGEVIDPEQFMKLPEEEQHRLEAKVVEVQDRLKALIRSVPRWQSESREKIKELNREVTALAVTHPIDLLKQVYNDIPAVTGYFTELEQDILDNMAAFLLSSDTEYDESEEVLDMYSASPRAQKQLVILNRYQINLLVDNGGTQGAPVVYEDTPTYQNLLGSIEHLSHMGSLITNFHLIKAGALHAANGGYLLVDALKVLSHPFAWEGLKKALRAREVVIDNPGNIYNVVSTVSLEPEPIPLDVKVILIGSPLIYYLLCHYDPEFPELFKVAVDFNEHMDRTPENIQLYADTIASLTRKEGLRPFSRAAVARIIEHSARLAEDGERLSTHMKTITDLLREADYWACEQSHEAVDAEDVQTAINAQIRRADRLREQTLEETLRGTILIDTMGEQVGQVNGLSVITMGSYSFGRPSRITARVHLGRGEVIDIERQVAMGGPIHSKGVLILTGFLGGRYAIDLPFSLSASIVFEQSYSGIEGDSASSAELYALLSALAEAPIKQSLAVTGSVNQHGQVQPIGGVNEKIEGFFDLCNARGLTGEQGVIIPQSNVKHLMLREDVVAAVKAGLFHIYAVSTIDEGIEILTGLTAGMRDHSGKFPAGSINERVEARLALMAEARIAYEFVSK